MTPKKDSYDEGREDGGGDWINRKKYNSDSDYRSGYDMGEFEKKRDADQSERERKQEEYNEKVSNKLSDAYSSSSNLSSTTESNNKSSDQGCAWLLAFIALPLVGMAVFTFFPSPVSAVLICIVGIIILIGITNS